MKKKLFVTLCILGCYIGYGQYTSIPDSNFELALISLGIDSEGAPVDGRILTTDIISITNLDISNSSIIDLSGLEFFSSLEILNVSGNNLDKLELQNTSLTEIRANNCNLAGKSIRFQNNPPSGSFLVNVTALFLENNNFGNAGSAISFGGIPNVEHLYLRGNSFGTLLLGETNKIKTLSLEENSNLTSITSLETLTELITLDITNCSLNILDITQNTNLTNLRVGGNPLTTLNLQNNILLNSFVIEGTLITQLDLSQNSNLDVVAINNSLISNIDLSNNPNLVFVNVYSNDNLSFLNLNNNNNGILTTLYATSNPNLNCLQVDNVSDAENKADWQKDNNASYSTNCNALNKIVSFSISPEQTLDLEGNYVITAGTNEIYLNYNLEDENGNELPPSSLATYNFEFSTLEHPINNTATGGNTTTNEIDFELITDRQVNATTTIGGQDGSEIIDISGDGIFEGDEYFLIEISSTDTNITLKNSVDGIVQLPVRIIDNEITNVNLEIVNNGIEGSQDVRLRIVSSLENHTGADMPFNITLQNGSATNGTDFELENTTIQLPNGASSIEFDISVLTDEFNLEGTEDFIATVSYAGDIDPNRIQIQNTTVMPTIEDADTTFTVISSLGGDIIVNGSDYEITEGNTFTLNFEANSSAPDGTQYTPIIDFSLNGNSNVTDFRFNGNETTIPNSPFTVSAINPDGSISVTAFDDGEMEGDETYTITISSPDSSLFTIDGLTSFEVTIKDNISSEPPSLTLDTKVLGATSLGYDLDGDFPVELFEIVEGSSLEITLNDFSSEGANGFPFSLPWSVSGITEDNIQLVDGDGNNLPFSNQELNFTVDTSNEFEIQINIALNDNEIFESNKEFTIQFKENGFDESLISIQNASNPSAPYRMRFTIVENDTEGQIITSLTSTGGRENSGITDKYEIALKYPNESYYKNTTGADIIIPIDFDNTDNQLTNPIDFNDISPNPLPQSFIIKPNDSTAIIELTYLEEIDVNDLEPNYFNLILLPVTSPLDLVHPQDTFLIKVLDENSPFDIITDFTGNVQRRDFGGEECCYFYQVEEGEDILFSFDAEKGVQDALPYLLNIEILNAEFSSNSSTRANYGDGSFTLNTNTLENIPRSVKIDQIDNFLNMRIEQGDYSSPKSFRITFGPPDNSNYEYVGPKDRDSSNETVGFDFEIIDAIPASIEATKATLNEEDPSDFAEVKIKLNTLENTNQEDISFSFILTENSTATFGVDYRIESNNDFEILEENIPTKSKKGVIYLDANSSPAEAVFRIIPINEPLGEEEPEGTETVIIELLDGFGYSIDNSNSFVEIDITDEDVGDYDVSLNVPNETLYEDSTRSPNSGVFEIQLFSNDSSASATKDIKVFFEIINEQDFAIEGDDFRIYDGIGNDKTDITNNLNKYVTIKNNESIGYIFIEVVTDDGEIEPNETVTINLKTGIGYNLNLENYTLSGSINIISKEQNTENLISSDLSAFVYSATCPEVSEGKIAMINNSPFDFNVELFNNSQEFGSADLQNGIVTPLVLFEDLEAGNYTVKLQAKGRDDIYPPSFNLTIRENLDNNQLLSSIINSEKKEVSLKVSGSKFYEVLINNKSYQRRFKNDGPNEFNLPLQIGKNSIQITGETQCQGIINHEIFFNNLKIFPNPTSSVVQFDGLSSANNIKFIFYNTSGKVVATSERLNQKSSNWEVNLESLSDGTYFCKIISGDKVINTLKLIKN
ncbi:Calx-beta domain-containing protein [Maribacter sp. 1_2014MBL_MicDiv]|uniref:Calx-beta domain-containing protein n=1 Tax=Maribacter sp. 1_2014MBL_MicDiv TaxID=1644130 RepID=UPI0008F4B789|nr:Calx-beta domain-containing protein [Maribacter sp. 1_2014MBL_MicDiv]APA64458.1 hypothetical protein YQ22_09080 [Maribacter sp. 1_2014MBL_MicDiv]